MYELPKGEHEIERYGYSLNCIENIGLGMSTTCAYYLHKDDVDDDENEFVQYFIESGLGCAVRLRSKYYSHFHGYAFNHQTSVPIVIKNGYVLFKNTGFNMIAWGPAKVLTQRRVSAARRL